MSETVAFSSVQLIIDNTIPTTTYLKEIFKPRSDSLVYDTNTLHTYETKIYDERFYWLYSNFGKAKPHRDVVIDITTHEEKENPRTKSQVEPTGQFFAIYDAAVSILYLSKLNKKSFFKYFASDALLNEIRVEVKNIYKTIEEFMSSINKVESIKFTGYRDLLTQGGDLMTPLKNIFGYDEPTEFTIEAKYNLEMKKSLADRMMLLRKKQSLGEIGNLVCIGRDDEDFEAVFNSESFTQKIYSLAAKDEQSLLLPDDVRVHVMRQLVEKHGV